MFPDSCNVAKARRAEPVLSATHGTGNTSLAASALMAKHVHKPHNESGFSHFVSSLISSVPADSPSGHLALDMLEQARDCANMGHLLEAEAKARRALDLSRPSVLEFQSRGVHRLLVTKDAHYDRTMRRRALDLSPEELPRMSVAARTDCACSARFLECDNPEACSDSSIDGKDRASSRSCSSIGDVEAAGSMSWLEL